MQSVVPLFADRIESEIYFLQTGQSTQLPRGIFESLNLVESHRKHSEVGRQKVDRSELVVVQEQFF